jgi:predicted house-cleaning noncanonical NTP pyrophosphatase (MazG superfamily)
MTYNKLVRDKIIEIIEAKGEQAIFHIADDSEYKTRLFEKLSEEIAEFAEAESMEELADVLEIIDAIAAYKNFDRTEVEAIKKEKAEKRGGFEKRIILEQA